jgi:hypothetical protein
MAPVTSRADDSAIRIDGTMLLDMEMLESGAQAARRSASTRLTQSRIRFQLAKVRLTTFSSALSDGTK